MYCPGVVMYHIGTKQTFVGIRTPPYIGEEASACCCKSNIHRPSVGREKRIHGRFSFPWEAVLIDTDMEALG